MNTLTAQPGITEGIRAYQSERNPVARAIIYAQTLRAAMSREDGCMEVLRAANTLGSVAGDLVVQRSLDLLKHSFPAFNRISTNMSSEGGFLDQEIITRLRSVPATTDYDANNGYEDSAAETTDVPVIITKHKACQVSFNANELGSTKRQLFGEQEEGCLYAIGLDVMNDLVELITPTNYTNELVVGNQIDFGRAKVVDGKIKMAQRNVRTGTRSVLLNSAYYGQLEKDTVLVGNLQNPDAGGAISTGVLPMVSGYLPIEADYLPTTNNLVGAMLRADAVALATRTPGDYASVFPDVPPTAAVNIIASPDTGGLSVMVVKFVSHKLGRATMRAALMWGVAKGQTACLERLVSASNS